MRGSDIAMAAVAVLIFAAFLGVLVWKVPSPALIVVCVLGVALAIFDFASTAVRHRAAHRRNGSRLPS